MWFMIINGHEIIQIYNENYLQLHVVMRWIKCTMKTIFNGTEILYIYNRVVYNWNKWSKC